ncbi:unnamed protein product [Protopolystoma xenopodis]|uniref:RING-type domain-containing protein n=1 Tax=Protopolystoma xenopodis TaxID=117903 RepID=A0A448WVK2_9PLAT|nr:unnamed protein product [Protopolystoma xenopodis]
MYALSLERVPLPYFSTYAIFTLSCFFGSVFRIIYDPNQPTPTGLNGTASSYEQSGMRRMLDACHADSWCFWSFINLIYFGLLCLGLTLQTIFFGELRPNEHEHIRENFWTFLFYKLVFIYGVLNVESLHELLLWAGWSSSLGFLQILTGLVRQRVEFLIQMPDTTAVLHLKMVVLLIAVLCIGHCLAGISIAVGIKSSIHLMIFMLSEVYQLMISSSHVLIRYGLHFYIESILQSPGGVSRINHSSLFYYVDLIFFSMGHGLDFVHNLHMLFWNNIQVNMSCLIVMMHLQYLYGEMVKRYKKHQRYLLINSLLFFDVVENPDEACPICWEKLTLARRLPCGHIFHDLCLRLWIDQSPSCPTCRRTLLLLAGALNLYSNASDFSLTGQAAYSSETPGSQVESEFNSHNSAPVDHDAEEPIILRTSHDHCNDDVSLLISPFNPDNDLSKLELFASSQTSPIKCGHASMTLDNEKCEY